MYNTIDVHTLLFEAERGHSDLKGLFSTSMSSTAIASANQEVQEAIIFSTYTYSCPISSSAAYTITSFSLIIAFHTVGDLYVFYHKLASTTWIYQCQPACNFLHVL